MGYTPVVGVQGSAWAAWGVRVKVRVVRVAFNSAGVEGGVAGAPAALRGAGLIERLGDVRDGGDVAFAAMRAERSARSGLLAEAALVSMVAATREAVAAAQAAGEFPLVIGGDCPVLLGALAATRDRYGSVGLVMVDGHEDNYPPHRSLTGEAADCELYLALGLPSDGLPAELEALTPLLEGRQVALIGPRDAAAMVRDGVSSLGGMVPLYTDVEVIVRGPREVAVRAASNVRDTAAAWWLHTDLDVLSTNAFSAVDYPQPGGLSWDQLREVTAAALATPGCAGWTVAIYNPDLDPDGVQAGRVIDYIAPLLSAP